MCCNCGFANKRIVHWLHTTARTCLKQWKKFWSDGDATDVLRFPPYTTGHAWDTTVPGQDGSLTPYY